MTHIVTNRPIPNVSSSKAGTPSIHGTLKMTEDPIKYALASSMKVWSIENFIQYMVQVCHISPRELMVEKSSRRTKDQPLDLLMSLRHEKSNQFMSPIAANRPGFHFSTPQQPSLPSHIQKEQFEVFKFPYIMIEDLEEQFKPIFKEYKPVKQGREPSLPVFYLDSAVAHCPFICPSNYAPSHKSSLGVAIPLKPSTDNKAIVEARIANRMKIVRLKKPGYCECCHEKYEHLEEHILLPKHRKFVTNTVNYAKIDKLIKELYRPLLPSSASPIRQPISTTVCHYSRTQEMKRTKRALDDSAYFSDRLKRFLSESGKPKKVFHESFTSQRVTSRRLDMNEPEENLAQCPESPLKRFTAEPIKSELSLSNQTATHYDYEYKKENQAVKNLYMENNNVDFGLCPDLGLNSFSDEPEMVQSLENLNRVSSHFSPVKISKNISFEDHFVIEGSSSLKSSPLKPHQVTRSYTKSFLAEVSLNIVDKFNSLINGKFEVTRSSQEIVHRESSKSKLDHTLRKVNIENQENIPQLLNTKTLSFQSVVPRDPKNLVQAEDHLWDFKSESETFLPLSQLLSSPKVSLRSTGTATRTTISRKK